MNGELLAVLDHIEREKGIAKEVLIQAVEAALVSASRKVLKAELKEDITVRLNSETGAIGVFSGKKEITPPEFGRIAAQTAKQVIIQKIREAERDVIYNDFHDKIGNITNGIAHRFDREGIIVDLGRAEAILPRREQLPREVYKQGQRVRAYILDVRRSTKGPQIILSRKHPSFLKRLFELEVPEIYEGIVEIKAIAREAGERAKIAVFSKDEKIDCVGACVGMRGSRVKNIVRELNGERIDVIRWSDNIEDYISAALSPAKINSMNVNKEEKRIEVIVGSEELSLAIGKRGQNVRLASKLTGWEIDVRSRVVKEEKEFKILELPGVGKRVEKALIEAKLNSWKALSEASVEDLMRVPGVGEKTAEKIVTAIKAMKGSEK
jgi:N utilization substance protein A